jgi:hypothetical protein
MDLLQFWPEGQKVEPWDTESSDKLFEDNKYIDEWVKMGNSAKKRSLANGTDDDFDHFDSDSSDFGQSVVADDAQTEDQGSEPTVALISRDEGGLIERPQLEKRLAFLIPIFAAIFRTAVQVGARAGQAAGAVLRVSRYTIRVGKGRSSKKSYKEQSEGAKKISQNKNWKRCLRREKPQK